MGIFQVIRSSVYDPAFYAGMRERLWSEGAKYYAVVAFMVVFIYVAPLWGLILQVRPELVDAVVGVYPEQLEVTYANGEIHTNQPEPFAIPNTLTTELPENLVVFDTQNDQYSPTVLHDAETLVLFKKTFVVTENTDSAGSAIGEQRVFSYGTSTGTSTLTKASIQSVADTIKPYVRPVAIVGGAFLFVLSILLGGLGMLVIHLVYLFFPSLLVFVYFKMRKRDEAFRTAYTTALFASIPVAIFAAVVGIFGTGLPPFMYTLVLLLIVIANDTRVKKPEVSPLV